MSLPSPFPEPRRPGRLLAAWRAAHPATPNVRTQLILVAWAVGVLVLSAVPLGWLLQRRALEDVRHEAVMQLDMAQAVRGFVNDHVADLLPLPPGSFDAATVPSFAATTTMRRLQVRYPDVRYREVSFNPLNLRNLATGVEVDLLRELQASDAGSAERIVDDGAGTELRLALPLRVTGAACLRCHGEPEQAPPGLRARYGVDHGYHWQVGQVIGAQVVAVPMQQPRHRAWVDLAQFLAGGALVVSVTAFVLNGLLRRAVVDPMALRTSQLERLAGEDPLTRALNRRSLLQFAQQALAAARGEGAGVSVVVVDIDHFKRVNDTWGHDAGDRVLKEFVRRLRAAMRRDDLMGRLGGEEFALVLPRCALAEAREVAQGHLAGVMATPFEQAGTITASFGVAQVGPAETLEAALARADAALYEAKRAGRACVVAAGEV